jgi:hypothetical protein
MTQPLVPEINGGSCCNKRRRRCGRQRVKIAGTVTSEEHRSGRDVLDRKTKGVKFDSHIVVASKRSNIKKVFD